MSDIKLYNEDCLNIMKMVEDDSVDCIITDPPYACTPHGTSGMGGIEHNGDYVDNSKEDIFGL